MIHRKTAVATLAIALIIATVPALGLGATEIYEADRSHDLTDDDSIRTYAATGNVTGEVDGLNMTVSVADKAGQVGLSEFQRASAGRVFVRVDYDESIQRTVRIFIPPSYFAPRLKKGLSAVEGDSTVDLEPGDGRNYTVMTVRLDGKTDAVYPVSVTRGQIADGRSWVSDLVGNATGINLPSITSGGKEWSTLSEGSLTGPDPYYRLPTNETVTVQYDADESPANQQWITVRACEDTSQPVCSYGQPGSNATYLRSQTTDPPRVRWRTGDQSVTGGVESTINDAQHGLSGLWESVGGFLGGN